MEQNTQTSGILLWSSVIHLNNGKSLIVQLDCCQYDDVMVCNSTKQRTKTLVLEYRIEFTPVLVAHSYHLKHETVLKDIQGSLISDFTL